MKMNYIKPVCDTQVLNITNFCVSGSVHGTGTGNDLGYGGKDDGSHDPDVKADNFWGDEEW